MSRLPKFVIVFVIPVVILAVGGIAAKTLAGSKEAPARKERVDLGTLVQVELVERSKQTVQVEAKGTVRASQRLAVQSQLGGEVTSLNERMVPGGLIKKGEVLFRIQGRDFRIAVDQRETSVAQAEAKLSMEEGQQRVARKEWELFKGADGANEDPSLALRAPQKRVAQVSLQAAKSQLEQAKLNLGRTTIRAPFNLMVENENLEVGQIVGPGSPAATVVGTDEFWVQVSVPIDRLEFIKIPGVNSTEGSDVTVLQTVGQQEVERAGKVVRLLGELDPIGRMARVLVAVQDPLNLVAVEGNAPRGLPFLLSAFVTVRFDGSQELEVSEIPRAALHEGDKAYVYKDDKLEVREVGVVWRRPNTVLIAHGLEAGDELVTSRISTPLPGMKLRKAEAEAK